MKIDDLRQMGDASEIHTDLCIIGSGPAGLTIASELRHAAIDTLIIESGGLGSDPGADGLNHIESVGAPRVMDQALVRTRIFGGTSHVWSGRCAPFTEWDFAQRDWVPHSGWPLQHGELAPHLARACDYLGLSDSDYDSDLAPYVRGDRRRALDGGALEDCFWQFSKDSQRPLDFMRCGPSFLGQNAPRTRVLLNANVTDILTNEAANCVAGVEVASLTGQRLVVRPKAVVLAAGGIENARIMLYSNRRRGGLGNQHGLVGRFLADHPRCTLAEIDLRSAAELQRYYGLFQPGHRARGNVFVRGVTLSRHVQQQRELLNCAAWMTEERAADDPWDAVKRLLLRQPAASVRDLWTVASQPGLILGGLANRLLQGGGVRHKLQRLVFDCAVEQQPNPDSRLTLTDAHDALGLPKARLDWRISDQEKATALALGQSLDQNFRQRGLPQLRLAEWVAANRPDLARFVDTAHPSGTTRMAHAPQSGVVDPHCQVHGVEGLFVAGSSVFPTNGHANPTLTIVALAIRLADHLKDRGWHAAPAVRADAAVVAD